MAEKFLVKVDHSSFITQSQQGKFSLTTNKQNAKVFDSRDKAINVVHSAPKLWRDRFIEIESFIVDDPPVVAEAITDIKEQTYNQIDKTVFNNTLNTLSQMLNDMESNHDYLLNQLSEIDKEICDLMHYIEFYSFSASDGYKLARKIKECRLKRRDIKNQLDELQILKSHSITNIASGKVQAALDKLDHQTYQPRVLNSLFEGKNRTGC